MAPAPVVLDCTLRDGGYYNSWDFDPGLVDAYLEAMGRAGVDVVEIGFRSLPARKYLGAFAYSTDPFLEQRRLPESELAVMINASELLEYGVQAGVDRLFDRSGNSPIDIVRVAVHFSRVQESRSLVDRLASLGYRVCLNLMQVGQRSPDEISSVAAEIGRWGLVQVLYVADSLGSMDARKVAAVLDSIRTQWSGPIGIHAHDNKGMALSNTLEALRCGASWLDGTILGMGRGAGNARTEHLLIELAGYGYKHEALAPLVMGPFGRAQEEYKWGMNLAYYLAATHGVHPTYVQEMSSFDYGPHQVLEGIRALERTTSYSEGDLAKAMIGQMDLIEGEWDATGMFGGRDVVLVGPKCQDRLDALERFKSKRKPYVIALNFRLHPQSKVFDAYAICHQTRLVTELEHLRKCRKPVFVPAGMLPEPIEAEVHDYGLEVRSETFDIRKTSCTIPRSLVAAYAMSIATAGGADRIYLYGFEGYRTGDYRQQEMNDLIARYSRLSGARPLVAITPSSYTGLRHSSIYEP